MDTTNLNLFFKRLSQDAAMRDDFVEFAAKFDVDLSELADADLDDVAGGGGIIVIVDSGLKGAPGHPGSSPGGIQVEDDWKSG